MRELLIRIKQRFFIFLVAALVAVSVGFAAQAQETPEDIAAKYNLTFPIEALGNCVSPSACFTYCEKPENHAQCEAYARAKGFLPDDPLDEDKDAILASAQADLGCDSEESCHATCQVEDNYNRCCRFAERHGLGRCRADDLDKGEIYEEARAELDCTSRAECKARCHEDAYKDQCRAFAERVGLRAHVYVGPGGCRGKDECLRYCQEHPGVEGCPNPREYQRIAQMEQCYRSGETTGEKRCWIDDACRSCPEFKKDPTIKACFRGGRCWIEGVCRDCPADYYTFSKNEFEEGDLSGQAQEYADFCRDNPGECAQGAPAGFTSQEERREFEDYCQRNPKECEIKTKFSGDTRRCPEGYTLDPINNYCRPSDKKTDSQCPAGQYMGPGGYCISGDKKYDSGYKGDTYNKDKWAEDCRRSGGTWTGSTCTYPKRDPKTECEKAANCSWNGSSCICGHGSDSGGAVPNQEQCPQGCSWTGSGCQCSYPQDSGGGGGQPPPPPADSGGGQPPPPPPESSGGGGGSDQSPEAMCGQTSGCHWEGGTCVCQQVQGVAQAQQGLIYRVFSFFARLFGLSY